MEWLPQEHKLLRTCADDPSMNACMSCRYLDDTLKPEQMEELFKGMDWAHSEEVDPDHFLMVLFKFKRFTSAVQRILPRILGDGTKGQLLSHSILKARST